VRWLRNERLEFQTPHPPEEVVERLHRVTGTPRLFDLPFARGGARFRGEAGGNHFDVRPVAWNGSLVRVIGDVHGDAQGSAVDVTIRTKWIDGFAAIVAVAAWYVWIAVALSQDLPWGWAAAGLAFGAFSLGHTLLSLHALPARARRTLSEIWDAQLHASRG
jgi:hypothetical protein